MLSLLRLSLPLALAALAGCPVWEPLASCEEFDACSTTDAAASSGSSGSTVPTTSAGGGVQTVTGDDEGTTSSPGTETGVETDDTGEPADLPEVLTFKLQPDPITANGPINVVVTAIHAEGVRMETGLGDVVELVPEAGKFVGEIPVLSGLFNGPHSAFLTPWKNTVDGATVPAPYEIALPEPGTEKKGETNDLIGPGQVVAMATLPTGEPVEFGNHSPGGEQHCFLRMRGKDGFWALADVVDVLPDTPCAAVDLKIDDQGALFVVFHQISNNSTRWRLMKIPAWGESPQHMELGAKDETAVALAHHKSGAVAVCGTAPTGQLVKVDAMARIIRPGLATELWAVDYQPSEKVTHEFAEQTQDCVFVGDTLTLVGEARGKHENELQFRDRLFMLRVDSVAQTAVFTVPSPGDQPQSGAQAADTDDQGNLIVAAYTCDDDCKPAAHLRIYDEEGTLKWQASLGTFPTKQFAAQDLVWSPAGYIVVATGGLKGGEAAFTVRAFAPSQEQALWTYTHNDLQVLQVALALAIGNYGEVFAGGFGANGFPAFAFIWG